MAENSVYCLHCFAELSAASEVCSSCGANPAEMPGNYVQGLIHALYHPLADVRMRAIIALGLRGETQAAEELADCALRHPIDLIEGLEIVDSLRRIAEAAGQRAALARIAQAHPAHAVRQAAIEALAGVDSCSQNERSG